MPKRAQAYFSELRELLNKPKTGATWEALRALLHQDEATSPEFIDQFKPAILDMLNASWPMELRIVGMHDSPHVHEYGRVFHLSCFGQQMVQFGAALGRSYKNRITKKLIKELLPYWMPLEAASYQGLILSYVDELHATLLEALLGTGRFKRLEYVRVLYAATRLHTASSLGEMTHMLIDQHGQTLRSFGCSLSYTSDRGWDRELLAPLLERAEELPALHELGFGQHDTSGRDIFIDFMEAHAYARLDTLTFPCGLDEARAKALMAREASQNLRRIRVSGVELWGLGVPVEALIHAPNLANVEAWDIKEAASDDESWDTQEVWRWLDYKRGVTRDELAFASVDLHHHNEQQTHAALFDAAGELRSSEELRALRIKNIGRQELFKVIAHAHRAWPKLERLVFMLNLDDPQLHEAWSRSPLLRHPPLRCLDWFKVLPLHHDPCHVGLSGEERARINQANKLEQILNDPTPFLAFRRWRELKSAVSNKAQAALLARQLKLSGYTKLTREQLIEQCELAVIAQLGGRARLLIDGPSEAAMREDGFA